MIVGVLGLQGAVREHLHSLSRLGIDTVVVKHVDQLSKISALVIPGGESTTISLLGGMLFIEKLRQLAQQGFPFFGTCAGMILLAREVQGQDKMHIGAIDITVARNASGRQVHSFETLLSVKEIGDDIPAVFIRAPYITSLGAGVRKLAQHDGHVVMARQGSVLVSSFHPELTDDLRIHNYFLSMVKERKQEVDK